MSFPFYDHHPRHIYVISFDVANTDLYYVCSHDDIAIDGVSASNIIYGDIKQLDSSSQVINPISANAEIGNLTFTVVDNDHVFSSLLNAKMIAGKGLHAKRLQHWRGKKGDAYPGSYNLVNTYQIRDSIGLANFQDYTFNGRDITRTLLDSVFDQKKTNLTASLSATGITVNAVNTTEFLSIQHGNSFSDAPNQNVGYIWIEGETLRWISKTATTFTIDNSSSTIAVGHPVAVGDASIYVTDATAFESSGIGYIDDGAGSVTEIKWLSKSGNILQNVTGVTATHAAGNVIVNSKGRGALNTVAVAHSVDNTVANDQKPVITERIYIEMNPVAIDYAIKTGINPYNATTWPSHWNLGIDTAWISVAQYNAIGADIYDPTNDTAGIITVFSDLKKTNAKTFCELQLLFVAGVYNPVLNTGELGLRRMNSRLSDAPYENILNEDNIFSITNVRYDLADIHNIIKVKWNYNVNVQDYTRESIFENTVSSAPAMWGQTIPLEFEFLGIDGSRHTNAFLSSLVNNWFDRHSNPPFKADIEIDSDVKNVYVGSSQRLQLANLADWTNSLGNYGSIDMTVEVQSIKENFDRETRTISVFGGTGKAGTISLGTDTTVIPDANYALYGSSLSAYLAAHYTAGTDFTDSAGILTIINPVTLPGYTDLTSTTALADNNQGVFYYSGDIINNGGINSSQNLQINCRGTFTNNSSINLAGGGIAASASGTAGGIGWTKAGGGFLLFPNTTELYASSTNVVKGSLDAIPNFLNMGAGSTNIVNNIPSDLRGTSGATGNSIINNNNGATLATGGVGGAGGGGLVIVCRGFAVGVSSSIILSGANGQVGGTYTYGHAVVHAGSGAGGSSGGFLLIADGANSIIDPDTQSTLHLYQGDSPVTGTKINHITATQVTGPGDNYYSSNVGYALENKTDSNYRLIYLIDNQTAASDAPTITSPATDITFTPAANTPQTPAQDLMTLTVTLTPPTDGNYDKGIVYYKLAGASDSTFQLIPQPAKNAVTVTLAMDGNSYIFRTYGVSITGDVSQTYTEKLVTIAAAKGGVNLANGNYFAAGKTSYSDTAAGFYIEATSLGGRAVFGGPTYSVAIDDTGNVNLTGTINASAGTIGGAMLSATQMYNSTNMVLDWSSKYLAINSATFGAAGIQLQYNSASPQLYCGNGTTQFLKYTGAGGVEVAGTITAYSGILGDFTLSTTQIYSGANHIVIDAASKYLAINSATFGNAGIQLQYNAGSPQLYCGDGATKYLKYTGANGVEVGGGTLSETVFQIYTSGLIRNNASPSTLGGFQLDNAYFRTWDTAATPVNTFKLDFATGSFTAGDVAGNKYLGYDATTGVLTATGLATASGTGQRIELNPGADNQAHFYGDRGDTTVEELATIGITNSGADYIVGNFGSNNAGNSRIGVYGRSYSASAVAGFSTTGIGVYARSSTGRPLYCYSNGASGPGSYMENANGAYVLTILNSTLSGTPYGVYVSCDFSAGIAVYAVSKSPAIQAESSGATHGPLKIVPKTDTTDPTTGSKGEFYVDSAGVLKFHNGTAWKTVTLV